VFRSLNRSLLKIFFFWFSVASGPHSFPQSRHLVGYISSFLDVSPSLSRTVPGSFLSLANFFFLLESRLSSTRRFRRPRAGRPFRHLNKTQFQRPCKGQALLVPPFYLPKNRPFPPASLMALASHRPWSRPREATPKALRLIVLLSSSVFTPVFLPEPLLYTITILMRPRSRLP